MQSNLNIKIIIKKKLGIIIDTFAVIREESDKKKADMENSCFICGNTRFVNFLIFLRQKYKY